MTVVGSKTCPPLAADELAADEGRDQDEAVVGREEAVLGRMAGVRGRLPSMLCNEL